MPVGNNLSIVIPVYNAQDTIGELVSKLFELVNIKELEVVLVNDASSDHSAEICKKIIDEFNEKIIFIDLARNFGEHNAVMAGLRHTTGEWIITIDDDFQNPPEEVVKLYDYACNNNYDVVYTYYSEKKHSLFRNIGSWFTNRIADFLMDKPKGLYLSSFRCMNRMIVDALVTYNGPYPYIDGIIIQISNRLGRCEVRHEKRKEGSSNYTFQRLLNLWASVFINFSAKPLHVSTIIGVLACLVGFAGALLVILEWFLVGTPPGWGSLMVIILLFSGTQLLVIGILGEYLGRVFMTINSKPQFFIREICHSVYEEIENGDDN